MKPTVAGKQNAAIAPVLTLKLDGQRVTVSDSFINASGKQIVRGVYDRTVGNDVLFGWNVSGVPRTMMPTELTWYRPNVGYRARFNQVSKLLKLRADYVPRYGGGNTGTGLAAIGVCSEEVG